MRLLIVSSEFPPGPGGIGTHAYSVAASLVKLGWEVAVVTSQDYASEDEIKVFNQDQPFPVVRLRSLSFPPLEALYRLRVLSRFMKNWSPNILMASGDRAVFLTAICAHFRRIPWIAVGHGTEFSLPTKWERALVRWSFTKASAVACVSKYTWGQMIEAGVRPKDGTVIQNGADAQAFSVLPTPEVTSARESLGVSAGHILLTVGSVTERKGQETVINALPHILRRVLDVHYFAAGMPVLADELRMLAKNLGVSDHVHFLGRIGRERLVQLLNCCDLFVMTSKHTADGDFEGYGIAVIEAALCGKPAVVSLGAGLAEAIRDGETGLGVPEGDEVATAQAILALLEDEKRRQRMGDLARRNALAQSTWDQKAREYEALLRRVLQTAPAAAHERFSEAAESARS